MKTLSTEFAVENHVGVSTKARPDNPSSADPYGNSFEHILAELERIDLLIEAQVARARQSNKDSEFQGLYVSEQEIDALIAHPIGLPRWATIKPVNGEPNVKEAIERLAAEIDVRKNASIDNGVTLRLAILAGRFQLTPFDIDVLLVCLATEIDLRYERLCAYLQDDVTRKRPSVDLVLNLLCPSFFAKLQSRARFDPTAALLKHNLIAVLDDGARTPVAVVEPLSET